MWAILSSGTTDHLVAAFSVNALRLGYLAETFITPFNQYRQQLLDPGSELRAFNPDYVLFSLGAQPYLQSIDVTADAAQVDLEVSRGVTDLREMWRHASRSLQATVVQQSILDVSLPLFGSFDALAPASPYCVLKRLNDEIAGRAADDGVLLLNLDPSVRRMGLGDWYDASKWHQAKIEIAPAAADHYANLFWRIVAAHRGQSRKCVVLDLDNTLWGGVVGDTGIDGLVLGPGSAAGEAFAEFQQYLVDLSKRGIILAVCSKNNPEIAKEAFDTHPEMRLKLSDIAAFVANWDDKAGNIQEIARLLNIGIDSLVFVDDNPAERSRVRSSLPQVAVPELPENPADYVSCVANAGYFETISFTSADASRARQYTENASRTAFQQEIESIDDFLAGLQMKMSGGAVTTVDLQRSAQLINKTNQFNTTGYRISADELANLITDDNCAAFQFRLSDRFGDNGLVSVMVVQTDPGSEPAGSIANWVMSCRVFGRQFEFAIMNAVVPVLSERGIKVLRARFCETDRNHVIADLFHKNRVLYR